MSFSRRLLQGVVVVFLALGAGRAPLAMENHGGRKAECGGRKAECTAGPVQTVLQVPGWFEGIAAAPNGDIFTSDQTTFEVFRITPEGNVTVFAKLFEQPNPDACCAGALGMTFSRDGSLWINMLDFWGDSIHHGVYRVAKDGSSELAVPLDVNVVTVPNGLVFDDRGNLYITESFSGSIWKVARGERVAKLWIIHELLAPLPTAYGFGANGIAYQHGALYVASSDQGTVVKVPIHKDGSAGNPVVFASGLQVPDGITLGPSDDLYVTFAYVGQVVRIAKDGTWDVVADLGLGANPVAASLVFGHGKERFTVNVTNFGSSWTTPAVVKVDLCERINWGHH